MQEPGGFRQAQLDNNRAPGQVALAEVDLSPAVQDVITKIIAQAAVVSLTTQRTETQPPLLASGNPLDNYRSDIEFRDRVVMGETFHEEVKSPEKNIFGKVKEGKYKSDFKERRLNIDQRRDAFLAQLPQIEQPDGSKGAVFPALVERLLTQTDISFDEEGNKIDWFTDSGELTIEGQDNIMVAIEGYFEESVDLADASYAEVLIVLSQTLSKYKEAIVRSTPIEGLSREVAGSILEADLAVKLMLGNHIANPSMGLESITELSINQRQSVKEVSAPDFDALAETARNYASYQTKIMLPTSIAHEKRIFLGPEDKIGVTVNNLYEQMHMSPNGELARRIRSAIEYKNSIEGTELTFADYRQTVHEALRNLYEEERKAIKEGKMNESEASLVMANWDLATEQKEGYLDDSEVTQRGLSASNQDAINKTLGMIRLTVVLAGLFTGVSGAVGALQDDDQVGHHYDPLDDDWTHYREATSGHGQMHNDVDGRTVSALREVAEHMGNKASSTSEERANPFGDGEFRVHRVDSGRQPMVHREPSHTGGYKIGGGLANIVDTDNPVERSALQDAMDIAKSDDNVPFESSQNNDSLAEDAGSTDIEGDDSDMSVQPAVEDHVAQPGVQLTHEQIERFTETDGTIFRLEHGETISHALAAKGISQEEMYGKDGESGIVKELETNSFATFTHEGKTYITLVVQDKPTDSTNFVNIVTPGLEVTREGANVIFVEVDTDALNNQQPGEIITKLQEVFHSGTITEGNLNDAINTVAEKINLNDTQQALLASSQPIEITSSTTLTKDVPEVVDDYQEVDQLLGIPVFTDQPPDNVEQEKTWGVRLIPVRSESSSKVDEALTITPVIPYSNPDGTISWRYDSFMGDLGSGSRLLVGRVKLDEVPGESNQNDFLQTNINNAPPPVEGRDYIRLSTIAEGSTLRDIVESHDLSLDDDENFTPTSTYVGTSVDGNWRSFAQSVGLPDSVQPEFRDGMWTTSIFREDGSKDLVHFRAYTTDSNGVNHPVESMEDGNLPPGTSIAVVNTNEFITKDDAKAVVNNTPVHVFNEPTNETSQEGEATILEEQPPDVPQTEDIITFQELEIESQAIASEIKKNGVAVTTPEGSIEIKVAVDSDNNIVSGENIPADTTILTFEITEAERPQDVVGMIELAEKKVAELEAGVPVVEGTPEVEPTLEATEEVANPSTTPPQTGVVTQPSATPTGTASTVQPSATSTISATTTSDVVDPSATPTSTEPSATPSPTASPTATATAFATATETLIAPTVTNTPSPTTTSTPTTTVAPTEASPTATETVAVPSATPTATPSATATENNPQASATPSATATIQAPVASPTTTQEATTAPHFESGVNAFDGETIYTTQGPTDLYGRVIASNLNGDQRWVVTEEGFIFVSNEANNDPELMFQLQKLGTTFSSNVTTVDISGNNATHLSDRTIAPGSMPLDLVEYLDENIVGKDILPTPASQVVIPQASATPSAMATDQSPSATTTATPSATATEDIPEASATTEATENVLEASPVASPTVSPTITSTSAPLTTEGTEEVTGEVQVPPAPSATPVNTLEPAATEVIETETQAETSTTGSNLRSAGLVLLGGGLLGLGVAGSIALSKNSKVREFGKRFKRMVSKDVSGTRETIAKIYLKEERTTADWDKARSEIQAGERVYLAELGIEQEVLDKHNLYWLAHREEDDTGFLEQLPLDIQKEIVLGYLHWIPAQDGYYIKHSNVDEDYLEEIRKTLGDQATLDDARFNLKKGRVVGAGSKTDIIDRRVSRETIDEQILTGSVNIDKLVNLAYIDLTSIPTHINEFVTRGEGIDKFNQSIVVKVKQLLDEGYTLETVEENIYGVQTWKAVLVKEKKVSEGFQAVVGGRPALENSDIADVDRVADGSSVGDQLLPEKETTDVLAQNAGNSVDTETEGRPIEVVAQDYKSQAEDILLNKLDEEKLEQLESTVQEARKVVSVNFRHWDNVPWNDSVSGIEPVGRGSSTVPDPRRTDGISEDAIWTYSSEKMDLGILLDGVGKEEAKSGPIAAEIFEKMVEDDPQATYNKGLRDIVVEIHNNLKEQGVPGSTTITLYRVKNGILEYANVGDSILMVLNPEANSVDILPRLHTMARSINNQGILGVDPVELDLAILNGSREEIDQILGSAFQPVDGRAINYEQHISGAINHTTLPEIDTGEIQLKPGDIVMASSDGFVPGNISPTELLMGLKAGLSIRDITDLAFAKAEYDKSRGAVEGPHRIKADDISVIYLEFGEKKVVTQAVHEEIPLQGGQIEEGIDKNGINPILSEEERWIVDKALAGMKEAYYVDTQLLGIKATPASNGTMQINTNIGLGGHIERQFRFPTNKMGSGHHVRGKAKEIFEGENVLPEFAVRVPEHLDRSYQINYYEAGVLRVFPYDPDGDSTPSYSLMMFGYVSTAGEKGRGLSGVELDFVFENKEERDTFLDKLEESNDPKRLIAGLINQTFQDAGEPARILNVEDDTNSPYEHPIHDTHRIIFYDPQSKRGKILERTEDGWSVEYESEARMEDAPTAEEAAEVLTLRIPDSEIIGIGIQKSSFFALRYGYKLPEKDREKISTYLREHGGEAHLTEDFEWVSSWAQKHDGEFFSFNFYKIPDTSEVGIGENTIELNKAEIAELVKSGLLIYSKRSNSWTLSEFYLPEENLANYTDTNGYLNLIDSNLLLSLLTIHNLPNEIESELEKTDNIIEYKNVIFRALRSGEYELQAIPVVLVTDKIKSFELKIVKVDIKQLETKTKTEARLEGLTDVAKLELVLDISGDIFENPLSDSSSLKFTLQQYNGNQKEVLDVDAKTYRRVVRRRLGPLSATAIVNQERVNSPDSARVIDQETIINEKIAILNQQFKAGDEDGDTTKSPNYIDSLRNLYPKLPEGIYKELEGLNDIDEYKRKLKLAIEHGVRNGKYELKARKVDGLESLDGHKIDYWEIEVVEVANQMKQAEDLPDGVLARVGVEGAQGSTQAGSEDPEYEQLFQQAVNIGETQAAPENYLPREVGRVKISKDEFISLELSTRAQIDLLLRRDISNEEEFKKFTYLVDDKLQEGVDYHYYLVQDESDDATSVAFYSNPPYQLSIPLSNGTQIPLEAIEQELLFMKGMLGEHSVRASDGSVQKVLSLMPVSTTVDSYLSMINPPKGAGFAHYRGIDIYDDDPDAKDGTVINRVSHIADIQRLAFALSADLPEEVLEEIAKSSQGNQGIVTRRMMFDVIDGKIQSGEYLVDKRESYLSPEGIELFEFVLIKNPNYDQVESVKLEQVDRSIPEGLESQETIVHGRVAQDSEPEVIPTDVGGLDGGDAKPDVALTTPQEALEDIADNGASEPSLAESDEKVIEYTPVDLTSLTDLLKTEILGSFSEENRNKLRKLLENAMKVEIEDTNISSQQFLNRFIESLRSKLSSIEASELKVLLSKLKKLPIKKASKSWSTSTYRDFYYSLIEELLGMYNNGVTSATVNIDDEDLF